MGQTKKPLSEIERKNKEEQFKESLIEDVFGQESGKVQMEKVTMLIWQFRDDPRVVQFVAQFVAKFSGSRDVFDGIEFYLPQIAHMIIHLEVDWDDAILERFALIISQHSLHFALQFNWILQGAIEDYQPETYQGLTNPAYNPLFYSRCVKLLSNIERCVVYGTPRTHELQRLYEKGKISKQEYELLELADRRFNATQLTERLTENNATGEMKTPLESSIEGWLLYKRRVRKSAYRRKIWKSRYFTASDRMVYCFDSNPHGGGKLIRAMPLEGAEIFKTVKGRHPFMFEVRNQHYVFLMRAKSEEDTERWINMLKDEAKCSSLFGDPLVSSLHGMGESNSDNGQIVADLTPSQRARYDFYKNERDFVRSLCDVAERLRFKERSERKKLAPGYMQELKIPPCAYVPMCNSTDVWRRVNGVVAKDTRVFNTKERCPVIMYFLTKRGEDKFENVDVADYMHDRFDVPDPDSTAIESIPEESFEVSCSDEGGVTINADTIKSVWHEEAKGKEESKETKGNPRVQKFMKEHVLQMMPNNIARQVAMRKSRRSKRSVLDMSVLPIHSVKILETPKSWEADDDISCFEDDDGVDQASLDRAKAIVCGGETWSEKSERMLSEAKEEELTDDNGSKVEIVAVIAKSNDDLRQEVFVMQMIHFYKSVFANEGLPIWLYTYRILSTAKDTGLIEVIHDSTSIDGLKKSAGYPSQGGLLAYFQKVYGKETVSFNNAQRNFMLSLVGYSIVSYLLGLKDRHNGNIMIDIRGHLIFIDFGFAMGMAPGHEWSFEKAPFKMTKDYMDVMGGEKSACFAEFKRLFVAGFEAARKSSQIALGLVEIMMYRSNFPCFSGTRYGGGIALKRFEDRLMLNVDESLIKKRALGLIDASIHSTGTALYDKFQYHSNGYAI